MSVLFKIKLGRKLDLKEPIVRWGLENTEFLNAQKGHIYEYFIFNIVLGNFFLWIIKKFFVVMQRRKLLGTKEVA